MNNGSGAVPEILRREARSYWWGILWAVLVFSVIALASEFAFIRLRDEGIKENELDFVRTREVAQSEVENEVRKIRGILLSYSGLFASSENVTAKEFATFGETLELAQRYPSLYAVSYLSTVRSAELTAFENTMRQEQPDFAVFPAGERETYVVVKYDDSVAASRSFIGYDVGSNPVRLAVLERSRDLAETVMSPAFSPIPDPATTVFMVVQPIYKNGAPAATVAQRRESLTGFVVALYNRDKFFSDILSRLQLPGLDIEVFEGETAAVDKLYFDSDVAGVEAINPLPDVLTDTVRKDYLGQVWTVFYSYHPSRVLTPWQIFLPNIVLYSGLVFGLLVAFLVVVLVGSRRSAIDFASKVNEQLMKFKLAVDNASSHIIITDSDGMILYANPAAEKTTGYAKKELVGNNPRLWGGLMTKEFYQLMWHQIKAEKRPWKGEIKNRRKNGELYVVTSMISPILDEAGELVGFVGIEDDITARKRTEGNLENSEKRYRLLTELSPYGIVVHQKGRVVYANRAAAAIEGFENSEEIIGKEVIGFVHPDYRKDVVERITLMLEQGVPVPTAEEKFIRRDGRPIDVEVVASPIIFQDQPSVLVVFQDITERKEARELLRKSEERYRQLAEAARDMIFIINREGIITYVNSFGAAQFGKKPEDLIGQSRDKFFGGETSRRQQESMKDVFELGKSAYRETETPFGSKKIWLGTWLVPLKNKEGLVESVLGISRDITSGVLESRRLAEGKAKDEAILASIGDGVVVVDERGVILLVNKAAQKLFGFGAEEMVGKDYTEVGSVKDALGNVISSRRPIEIALSFGETVSTSDYFYTRKDGTAFPVHVTVAPVKLEERVVGAVDIFRDISMEKAIDQAKTEFVSLASHQLRTPLSAVSWYTEMLLNGDLGQVDPRQKKYIEEIFESNKRMIELVNALLNVSRIDLGTFAIEPESVDVVEIAKSIVAELSPQTTFKKQLFAENYDPNIPKVQADPKLVRIILQNLVGNAVKYTDQGGRGELAIRLMKAGESAGGRRAGREGILIKVSDNGCGIPKAQQNRIFEKLFRADNVKERDTEGTGLGLYIVKSIVEAVDGKIWFESVEKQGSTFYVFLPLSGMQKKEGTKTLGYDVFASRITKV